jgi:hypothetical protein
MITQYFDINARLIIQSPGTIAPASPTTWVYGDNFNLAIYLLSGGVFQPIAQNDTLGLMLFQPGGALPETNLAIIGSASILTDDAGYQYYKINVNLATTNLASLVQSSNKAVQLEFHYVFTPADGERFSSSADLAVTLNPDPTQSASGATPVPPGYPSSPAVFEVISHKGTPGGYAGLDSNANLDPNKIPTDTTLTVTGGKLGAVGGGSGVAYSATITGSFTVPAAPNTVAVTLNQAVPDILAGQSILVTDGTHFMNGIVASITGTALSIQNIFGAGGALMAANAHVYLGNSAALATTSGPGLVGALSGQTNQFWRGDGSYAQPSYAALANIPSTFLPSAHGSQHLPSGNDSIALVTPSLAGLCPPIDNSTILISGGKLVAQPPAGAGNPYVAIVVGTPTIPAAGASVTLTLTATWGDFAVNQSCLVADSSGHFFNGIITAYTPATPSISVQNLGTNGSSVSGNLSSGAHVYLSGTSPLATAAAPGIVKPDGTSITVSAGTISALGQHGVRCHNSASISCANGLTTLTFDTNDYDTDGYHSTTINPSRITIPAGQAGYYSIGGMLNFVGSASGTYRKILIQANGSANKYMAVNTMPNGTNMQDISCSAIVKFAAGDYIEFIAGQDTGSALNAQAAYFGYVPSFWAMRIS